MNYDLNSKTKQEKPSVSQAIKKLWPLLADEQKIILLALVAVVVNSALSLVVPRMMAHAIDAYLVPANFQGVLVYSIWILLLFLLGLLTSYIQIRMMGGVGQRVLFNLRSKIFSKIQELPLAFFTENKSGDLISRINNDTEKINLFFSQSLVQFFGNLFIMVGSAVFLLSLNLKLGFGTLAPAIVTLGITALLSGWVKRTNATNAKSLGGLSSEIQESLSNFKVVVAFNRRDYFKKKFLEVNNSNYKSAVSAGIANNTFVPIYTLAANLGQLIVVVYGVYLISLGQFSIGLLISFLAYANYFYNPMRQLAALWASFQAALASWDRVYDILALETNLTVVDGGSGNEGSELLEFENVSFGYTENDEILKKVNLSLQKGRTYALVGPTGGGKTTTASLMARLFDPSSGLIKFFGRDLRSYTSEERAAKIGFILQDPILFSGNLRDNIVYGNTDLEKLSNEDLKALMTKEKLDGLLERFKDGLETKFSGNAEDISLGQKQLVAFIRAVLRKPDLLILDEATANIDTVTEKLLEEILKSLPESTTKVIIAHRLNTIENADEIYFVNAGELIPAGSMEHALEMLLDKKSNS